MNNKKVACGLPFVLENTDEGLHAETSEDNSNPAEGTEQDSLPTGFNHTDEIGFETNSTHSHDDKEFRELFERSKEVTADTEGSENGR